MKLKIDFISQQGNAARNDCGAACVAMCASDAGAAVTVDTVLAAIQQPKNVPLHFGDIYQALRAYRLPYTYVRPLHLPNLRQHLTAGQPVIALVGYNQLPPEQKARPSFNGAHFVVVVGFTADSFYVHDPLWPGDAGAFREWSMETMGLALLQPGWGNQPSQGLVVQQAREIVEPGAGELGLAVSAVMRETTARHYLEQLYGALGVAAEGSLAERQGHALAVIQMKKGAA